MAHPENRLPIEPDLDLPVVGLTIDRGPGILAAPHHHPVGQLLYAIEGSLKVMAEGSAWVVPPERAVWVPARVRHSVQSVNHTKTRTIYVDQSRFSGLPETCCVVHVTPLLRELLLELINRPRRYARNTPQARLAAVLVDQIVASPVVPCRLPMPRSDALGRLVETLAADPTAATLADASATAGLSPRTFQRRFAAETGMSFRAWLQQAKLLKSLEFLSEGRPVGDVSFELGYETPSAFIAMFRKAFGVTPGRYFGRDAGASSVS